MLGNTSLSVYNPIGSSKSGAPSTTPHPQAVSLTHKKKTFKFIDTPGYSFIPNRHVDEEERERSIARDILLRNRGNIVKINDPLPAALYVLSRARIEDMMMLYNLPAVQTGDYDAFLASLARKEGALQKRVRRNTVVCRTVFSNIRIGCSD
jgi:nuclear GTP-binding protein